MKRHLLRFFGLRLICVIGIAASASIAKAESVQKLQARALAGDAKAQFALAKVYEVGDHGVKPDMAYALSWYEEAARNGLKVASYRLKMLNQP